MNDRDTMKPQIPSLVVVALLAIVIAIPQPAHAQTLSQRTDRSSYVPGDTGTLILTFVNESPTETIELRNLTIYFPWAGYIDAKWQGNVTENFSPFKALLTSGSGQNIYTHQVTFTIPSWYSGSSLGFNCPGTTITRYGLYGDCILVGSNQNNLRYDGHGVGSIPIALPVYNPVSLVSMAIPIATLVVLAIATGFLAMTWSGIRRLESKK